MLAPAYVPTCRHAVSSAMKGLTSGFGMEPGVPPSPWEPTNGVSFGQVLGVEVSNPISVHKTVNCRNGKECIIQKFDLLVLVS